MTDRTLIPQLPLKLPRYARHDHEKASFWRAVNIHKFSSFCVHLDQVNGRAIDRDTAEKAWAEAISQLWQDWEPAYVTQEKRLEVLQKALMQVHDPKMEEYWAAKQLENPQLNVTDTEFEFAILHNPATFDPISVFTGESTEITQLAQIVGSYEFAAELINDPEHDPMNGVESDDDSDSGSDEEMDEATTELAMRSKN